MSHVQTSTCDIKHFQEKESESLTVFNDKIPCRHFKSDSIHKKRVREEEEENHAFKKKGEDAQNNQDIILLNLS